MKLKSKLFIGALSVAIIGAAIGCGSGGNGGSGETTGAGGTTGGGTTALKGDISIDGSSTVYPISQAASEEFHGKYADVKFTVNKTGTGGGMKKFVNDEIDICDASRAIEQEEIDLAKAKGVEFVEIPIAFDGISVVVNKDNAFAETLTKDELMKMWAPGSKINNWKDVRPGFPDLPLKLYGPDAASGTFEYFTEAIVGKKKSSRTDYTSNSDDQALATGIKGDKGALGYFGFHYYQENQDGLKAAQIDAGKGAIAPTADTINDGTYAPLSRPLFLYVKKSALARPEVKEFIKYYLSAEGQAIIKESGYVTLPANAYTLGQKRADEMKTGTLFLGAQPGMKIEELLSKEGA